MFLIPVVVLLKLGLFFEKSCKENRIHNNSFSGNHAYAIDTDDSEDLSVQANSNYWGDKSGPYHPENNPKGRGDNISSQVIISDWLNDDPVHEFENNKGDGGNDDNVYPLAGVAVTVLVIFSSIGLICLREDFRYLFLSLLTLPLYTKIEKDDILTQENRREVYTYLVNNPGTNLSKLHKKLSMGYGTLVHHLKVLERENHIRSRKEIGRKFFYPKDSNWDPANTSGNLSIIPIRNRIFDFLTVHGPATSRVIEQELFISQQSVSYNLRKLEEEGKVGRSGDKRRAIFSVRDG